MSGQQFEAEVTARFGIFPNFFRSAAPEMAPHLWAFAEAAYLDNPMPSVFKERLFVWLSRFCPVRYCIVRHVGFLLGQAHGRPAGDISARPHSVEDVVGLLRAPSPWMRDMGAIYAFAESRSTPIEVWPEPSSEVEDALFALAALMIAEPVRSERARRSVIRLIGMPKFELLAGYLAFIRTAHYWTMLHPEIETEDDMTVLLKGHEELARLLLQDPEADRCEMGGRLFDELTTLRDLHERRELEKAKQSLQEKDRQKDEFIAILAHELRNPLGAIRAATDALALIKQQDPRAQRLIERLDRQTTATARMLEDLLDSSRVALGKVSINAEQIHLNKLLAEILDEQRQHAQQEGVQLILQAGEPLHVSADQTRLRQILDNLISNSIKFTQAGGTVEVSLAREGAFASIAVSDSGVGFDEEFAAKLFDPFTQRDQDPSRGQGGLGLGLAIASRLALLQGGMLEGKSDGIDKGAVFTLRLPVVSPRNDVPTALTDSVTQLGQKILIVEDNEDMAQSFAMLLELSGFDVTVTSNGHAAIDKALEIIPDLIVCDLRLCGAMDGLAVARRCRSESPLRTTRLVALSGYSAPEDHERAKVAGFERLFTKPLSAEGLAWFAALRG